MASKKNNRSVQNKATFVVLAAMGIMFNIYFLTGLFQNTEEMFFWPRLSADNSLELPSIMLQLPLWVGVNFVYFYVLRSSKKETKKSK